MSKSTALKKVLAIVFAMGIVGYLVLGGHEQANDKSVQVRLKLKSSHGNSVAKDATLPAPDALSKTTDDTAPDGQTPPKKIPGQEIFMHSSKTGVFRFERATPVQMIRDLGLEDDSKSLDR